MFIKSRGVDAWPMALSGIRTAGHLAAGALLAVAITGTAQAVQHKVGTKQLKNGAVTAKKLHDASVTTAKLAPGAVGSQAIADGGVAAADLAPGAVGSQAIADGSVAAAELAPGAVGSQAIANGSVAAADLAPGVVPGAAWVDSFVLSTGTPASTPDVPNTYSHSFNVPHAGDLLIRLDLDSLGGSCTGGTPYGGLYVDGLPAPQTRKLISPGPEQASFVGTVPVTAGSHAVSFGMDCPSGTPSGLNGVARAWSVVLGN